MPNIDIKTIPEEAAKHHFLQKVVLVRIELRTDNQRRMVSAVFSSADGNKEDKRTLIWEPSEDRYHYEEDKIDVDKDWAISLQNFWASMIKPADAQLLKHQLGIAEGVRESIEAEELLNHGAGI